MKSKTRQSEAKNSGFSKRLICAAAAIIAVLVSASVFIYFYQRQPIPPRAAIIDQLSSSQLTLSSRFPNQTFVNTTKALLYKRFPEVDYYSDNATVDQYKSLPSLGYKLIIWRAHSALDMDDNHVAISTSERNGSRKFQQYLDYLYSGQLTLYNVTGDPNYYFAITPKFVEEVMSGSFGDAVIILMSCNGLKEGYFKTAETFLEKGAKVFISWNNWIDSSDNDNAITLLLEYLIIGNSTIAEAVDNIPTYTSSSWGRSQLHYYPNDDAGVSEYRIPNYRKENISTGILFAVALVPLRKIKNEAYL